MKAHNSKLCRWSILLSQYQFGVVYKEGKRHQNADFMSRCTNMISFTKQVNILDPNNNEICSTCTKPIEQQQGIECQLCSLWYHLKWAHLDQQPMVHWYCKQCQKVISQKGALDITQRIDLLISIAAAQTMGINDIKIEGKIYRWEVSKLFIWDQHKFLEYPTVAKRHKLIEIVHTKYMHIGSEKMFEKIRQEYFWNFAFEDCYQFVKKCLACQLQQPQFRKNDELTTTWLGVRPRQVYSIDLIPDVYPKSTHKNNQIVILVDNFSKFTILGALDDRKSTTLANWLMKEVIGVFGPPCIIKSDNGREFAGLFQDICEALRIDHRFTLPYHPQANGIAERFVRTMKTYLIRYLVLQEIEQWEEALPQIAYSINTTISQTYGLTPFEIEFGTGTTTQLEDQKSYKWDDQNQEDFFQVINRYLDARFRTVNQKFLVYQSKMRDQYQRRRSEVPPQYEFIPGMLVILRNFNRTRLGTKAIGPFKIQHIIGNSAYLKPLVKIKGFERLRRYSLSDMAPLELNWDLEEEDEADEGRPT